MQDHSNGIGNITNSQIGDIRQTIRLTPDLSDDVKEALVAIIDLLKRDSGFKNQDRLDQQRQQLTDDYRKKTFNAMQVAWFLTVIIGVVIFLTCVKLSYNPFSQWIKPATTIEDMSNLLFSMAMLVSAYLIGSLLICRIAIKRFYTKRHHRAEQALLTEFSLRN